MGIVNPLHLIFVAVIALVVLGPKRLPELARSLGNGMREFRESISEAVGGEEHVTGSLVPEEAQLVPATEQTVQPASVSTPVVDPGAPAQPTVPAQTVAPVQPVAPAAADATSVAPAPPVAPAVADATSVAAPQPAAAPPAAPAQPAAAPAPEQPSPPAA